MNRRKLGFSIFIALILIGVAEGLFQVAAPFLQHIGGISLVDFYEKYEGSHFGPVQFQKDKAANPYWGMQYLPDAELGINNFGFLSHYSYPIKKKKDDFVIGILGGSVAMRLGSYMEAGADSFVREIFVHAYPELKSKNIIVANLAVEAGKQPQQFIISSMFSEMLDVVVNVEGFNELDIPFHPYRPVEYPANFPSYAPANPSAASAFAGIKIVQAMRLKMFRTLTQSSLLRKSGIVFMAWGLLEWPMSGLKAWLMKTESNANEVLTKGLFYEADKAKPEEKTEMKINNWIKFSRMQHDLFESRGIPSFFFLQPNQYVEGSKEMSDSEKRVALGNPRMLGTERDLEMDKQYSKARESGKQIGSHFFDLSYIFKSTKEDVYIDNCCHVNNAGNQILMEAIVERMRSVTPHLLHHKN